MKISNLSRLVGAGVIAASLTVVPFTQSAEAQNTSPDTTTDQSGQVQTQTTETENDNSFDWGWLGLLGLPGLLGLAGLKRKEPDHVNTVNRDPNLGVRSGSDFR
jgi:hypothetical protein